MAENGSEQSAQIWPIPKFRFEVTWDSTVMSFQEVSGLDFESQPIQYRAGNSKEFALAKMPGLKKFTNVTLKKGMSHSDNEPLTWFTQVKTNPVKRKSVTISLLDESGKPVMTWLLTNAWPTKLTSADLRSTPDDLAIETLEIAYEALTIVSA